MMVSLAWPYVATLGFLTHSVVNIISLFSSTYLLYICIIIINSNHMKTIAWNIARNFVHDASGIEHPENYVWVKINGIYYPHK